jgi:hypothetical protein
MLPKSRPSTGATLVIRETTSKELNHISLEEFATVVRLWLPVFYSVVQDRMAVPLPIVLRTCLAQAVTSTILRTQMTVARMLKKTSTTPVLKATHQTISDPEPRELLVRALVSQKLPKSAERCQSISLSKRLVTQSTISRMVWTNHQRYIS